MMLFRGQSFWSLAQSATRLGDGRGKLALGFPQSLYHTTGDRGAELRHHFCEGGPERVVAAFREHVGTGRDQVDIHLKGGAAVRVARQFDVGLVNLPELTQSKYLLLDPRIQSVRGGDVEVLQVESHVRCHGFCMLDLLLG